MQEYKSAVSALSSVIHAGKNLDASFGPDTSPLAKYISYGVIRYYYSLQAELDNLLEKPLAKKHGDLQLLLLAGLFSIDHLNRPAHASVNAVVETATNFKKKWAKSLLNGVLRQYIRNQSKQHVLKPVNAEIEFNFPHWLIERISDAYPNEAPDIMAAGNTQAPMTLRVNVAKGTRLSYQTLLDEAGISYHLGYLANSAIILDKALAIEAIPGFMDGLVSVQDEASQLVSPLLNLKPGLSVLDACAAPGGKTCHILELQSDISLLALDIEAHRLELVKENLSRLDLDCALLTVDFSIFETNQKFDRILLDAPCSATGIIRRHPDIKMLRRDEDIDKLVSTQLKLLDKAWSLLKEDGELVYSTCSILPTENEEVVKEFLHQNMLVGNNDATAIQIDGAWGKATENGHQLLPSMSPPKRTGQAHHAAHEKPHNQGLTTGPDGFFFSRLKKQSS